ncbi:MAG: hypothetical protein H8E57_04505 [Candidatus Cloacimonetes bacterium]|nr:hypothetical protein [Candidatus Cloacimonadota bacterium]
MIKEIEILIEMQKRDDIIGEKEEQAKILPLELSSMKENLQFAEDKFNETKKTLDKNHKDQKLKELTIKGNKDKINKYKIQLLDIKTNKEYKALNSEISHHELKNSGIDDELIILMEQESKIKDNLKEVEAELKIAETDLKENEDKINRKIEIVQAEIDSQRKERNDLAKKIPRNMVKRYGSLIKNRSRKAVVFCEKNACSGCGFNVRPQLLIEINEGKKIISCESCGRILVQKTIEK